MMSWLFRGLIIFCPLSVIYYMVHRLASVYLFSYSFLKIWKTLIWDWIVLQYEAFLLLLDAIFLFFYICFIFDVGPKTKKLLVSKSSGKHTFCIWGQNWSKGKVSKPAQRKKPNCLMCETAWCKETILIPLVHWQWDCSIFSTFPLVQSAHEIRPKCGGLHKHWADSKSQMIKMLEIETNRSICAHGLLGCPAAPTGGCELCTAALVTWCLFFCPWLAKHVMEGNMFYLEGQEARTGWFWCCSSEGPRCASSQWFQP